MKAGVLASWNKKSEDTIGNGSDQNSRFWGATGFLGGRGDDRQRARRFPAERHDCGASPKPPPAARSRSAGAISSCMRRIRGRSTSASPSTTASAIRCSSIPTPPTIRSRASSRQLFNAALGSDACNGVLQPPGSNVCQDAGALGGTDGPNRSLMDQDYNNFAPRLGIAWNVRGDGKTALRAGLGKFYLRERLSPGLNIAGNPPFVSTISGNRLLDTTAEPCGGLLQHEPRLPLARPRSRDAHAEQLAVECVGAARGVEEHDDRSRLRGQLWLRHAAQLRRQPGRDPATPTSNGVDDRLDYARTPNAALRPFGAMNGGAVTIWDHSGKSTYHSLQTQFISRFGRGSQFQASYTLSRSRANLAMTNSDGALSVGVYKLDIERSGLRLGPARDRSRLTSSTRRSSGCCRRSRIVRGSRERSSAIGRSRRSSARPPGSP